MNRRHLLGLVPAAALAACGTVTTSKTGSVTTVVVDLQRLSVDVDAFVAAGNAILALASAIPQVAAVAPAIRTGVALVQDMHLLVQDNPSMSVTFDQSAPPAALNSLLADAQAVTGQLATLNLPAAQAQKVSPWIAAAEAAVAAIWAAMGTVKK